MVLPSWLKVSSEKYKETLSIRGLLPKSLNTVCESALCPNRGECFSRGVISFMILGDRCTRKCTFCAVSHDEKGLEVDAQEIVNVINTIKKLQLSHVVITSVTRDDLIDGGADQFASLIIALKTDYPNLTIEVLTPDFQGNYQSLDLVLKASPAVFNHNIETIPRLYSEIKPQGNYLCSLAILGYASKNYPNIIVKSGLMLGFGESKLEIEQVLKELYLCGVKVVTIGQYLAPSRHHAKVKEYVHPDQFKHYADYGYNLGFNQVVSGPLVRSSYQADKFYQLL